MLRKLSKENKVCLIDADLGLKNLDVVLGIENRVIFDILFLLCCAPFCVHIRNILKTKGIVTKMVDLRAKPY